MQGGAERIVVPEHGLERGLCTAVYPGRFSSQ
jgi:hypothetical protein